MAADDFKHESYCPSDLQGKLIGHNDADKLTQIVKFIWYPKSEYGTISHVELAIDGQMWDATAGYKESGSLESRERAARISGKGYLSFSLIVTPEEKSRIQRYIRQNSGRLQLQFCGSGACKALQKNSAISIPFPFSQVPTLSAIYLSVRRLLGYKRIARIEYVGKNCLVNLLSPALIGEGAMTYVAGQIVFGLIVWVVNETGELIRQIIPIISSRVEHNVDPMISLV